MMMALMLHLVVLIDSEDNVAGRRWEESGTHIGCKCIMFK